MAWTDDTADALLVDVRNTGFLPDSSDQTDAVLLKMADSEQRTMIAAAVKASRGEHWLRYEDTTIVPGTTRYRLPRRALADGTRTVIVLDPSGNPVQPLAEVDAATMATMFQPNVVGDPRWFSFNGEYVDLGAVPGSTGWTLRILYTLRPSKLVVLSETEMAKVYQATTTTNLRIIETAPSTNLTALGAYLDVVRGVSPYGLLAMDRLSNNTFSAPNFPLQSSTPIVVADFPTLTSPLAPGAEPMWLVQRDQSPFPMIPKVMWDALVHGVCAQALLAVRDPQAVQMRQTALAKLQEALSLIGPRDQRNSKKIIARSALRVGRGGKRRWWPA